MVAGADASQDVAERTVQCGPVPVHVVDYGGAGRAVVLLHGGGRSSSDWGDVAVRLRVLGRRPVALDLRGHGSTPAADWSWELALSDIATVVDTLSLIRPAVVGHSLGGMIAALWATEHSDCSLAVNIDGHGNPTRADQYAGLGPAEAARAHAALQAALGSMSGALDDHFAAIMRSIDDLDLFAVYRSARSPLLVTRGTSSMAELLPPDAQEAWRAYEQWTRDKLIATSAANAAVEFVETSTGHDAHLEKPELVTNLIHNRMPAN
jgi:pimeloyl-ACP methyl ester carboxylesterase